MKRFKNSRRQPRWGVLNAERRVWGANPGSNRSRSALAQYADRRVNTAVRITEERDEWRDKTRSQRVSPTVQWVIFRSTLAVVLNEKSIWIVLQVIRERENATHHK
jgi:hypothetical protein